jgi:hypothetical protein
VPNTGLIPIGATNYPEKIPPGAFARFGHKIFIGLPSLDNVREILMRKIRRMGWDRIDFFENGLFHGTREASPRWLQEIDWQRDQFITTALQVFLDLPVDLHVNRVLTSCRSTTIRQMPRSSGAIRISYGLPVMSLSLTASPS